MPPRLRPTKLEYVVDGAALRARLATVSTAVDAVERRKQALTILKQALSRGRLIAKERLENGGGGVETATLISGVTDEVVRALFQFSKAQFKGEAEKLSLLAVGGYGRGVLAPFSDIDLLFLRPAKQTASGSKIIEYMLHAMWDLGFKVGHASRTIEECIKLSKDDMTIRTSLLEMRWLDGDEKLATALKRHFREDVMRGTGAEFVAAKLKERDQRHDRDGSARYLVEPNVKEGKGALRDLHTLAWIAEYLHPVDRPEDVFKLEYFDRREARVFLRAFEFLHAVRAHLHFVTGRAEERLSFDLQPEIARRMGYGNRGDAPAVERFMRRYFLIVKEVGALTRAFSAQLEQEEFKKEPRGLSRFLPKRGAKRKPLEIEGFVEEGGRLNIDAPDIFERDPVNIMRLFRLADQRDLDLHPDAFTAVNRALPLVGGKARRDPEAAKVFLDILARGKRTYRTLTLMNDSGVLGRFMPEFGRVVAQMQFNMYHSYTVDEHTLRAIGVICDIANGRFKEDHPLSSEVMPLIEDREALFLAMLLHDTGKGSAGGQEKAGARAARSACERLGLDRGKVELVAWLVEHHLVMSDTAQKRDVTDPKTAAQFARIVESPERLRLLLVLTVADIRAVGPGVWNGWKGQLMRELYTATEAVFRGGRSDAMATVQGLQRDTAAKTRATLIAADPVAKGWAQAMEDAYFTAFSDAEYALHAQLSRRAAMNGGAAAHAQLRGDLSAAEVTVSARDRRGLFADFAMAIAGLGGNIVGARVFTSRQGWALDVFHVQNIAGQAFGADNPRGLKRLADALEAAGRGTPQHFEKRRATDMGRTAAFAITPAVVFDNEASSDDTVIEASGRDRPGLLEALARTLADAQLSIQSAHIDGYGERATDVFYVQTAQGERLTDPRRIASIKAGLTAVLEAEESAPPKRKLEKARASVAR